MTLKRDVILYTVRKQRTGKRIRERESKFATLVWTQVKAEGKSISLMVYIE